MSESDIRDALHEAAHDNHGDFVSSRGAAAHLGIAEGTLRKWRMRSFGPRFQRIGGKIRYLRADLDNWLKDQFVDDAFGGEAR